MDQPTVHGGMLRGISPRPPIVILLAKPFGVLATIETAMLLVLIIQTSDPSSTTQVNQALGLLALVGVALAIISGWCYNQVHSH